jgi:hypothetical protein
MAEHVIVDSTFSAIVNAPNRDYIDTLARRFVR